MVVRVRLLVKLWLLLLMLGDLCFDWIKGSGRRFSRVRWVVLCSCVGWRSMAVIFPWIALLGLGVWWVVHGWLVVRLL